MHKPEREQALAKTAIALMGECDVPATPDNFELFYAYASGENSAIAKVVGAHIAARKPFSAEMLQDLRLRCLSNSASASLCADNWVQKIDNEFTVEGFTSQVSLSASLKKAVVAGPAFEASS